MVTLVGTAGWAVALVILLIVRDSLPADERWWIWTCVTGLGMGLFALWYVPRLKRTRARAAARTAAESEPETEPETEPESGPESEQGQSAPRDNGSNTVSSTETPGRSTRS
jgi:hypothetical protein